MRLKGSAEALEMRRMIGDRLLFEGKGVREVSRLTEASPSSVWRWKQALEQGGLEALGSKLQPERASKLTVAQRKALEALLLMHRQNINFERVGGPTTMHRHLERKFITSDARVKLERLYPNLSESS